MITEDPDILCMSRLKSGEDVALNEIMIRWQQRLASYLLRLTFNSSEALDLTQETFIRIYQARNSYEPKASFPTWLFHIATNLYKNQVRWKSRHPQIPLSDPETGDEVAAHPDKQPSPDESLDRKYRSQRIAKAIKCLPDDLRSALVLFEYEDCSYADIAAIEDCTVKTVETRIYRARQILREKLADLMS